MTVAVAVDLGGSKTAAARVSAVTTFKASIAYGARRRFDGLKSR